MSQARLDMVHAFADGDLDAYFTLPADGKRRLSLERHSEEDRALRETAAADLASRLTERELLFGARGGLVSLPGSTPSWRSAIDER